MLFKSFSLIFIGLGVFVLVQVAAPFFAYKIWEVTAYNDTTILIDPGSFSNPVAGVSVKKIGDFPAFISDNATLNRPYAEFRLSIPKINLQDIKVLVDSNNFEHNLAQLPGTALPGERGNIFVTGHSSLPAFFKEDNFKAIFANLSHLKKDDEIFVTAAGQEFVYVVEGLRIVEPTEVGVINPPDSMGRYLTLMTCVPPGFNTKRLVVLARLK